MNKTISIILSILFLTFCSLHIVHKLKQSEQKNKLAGHYNSINKKPEFNLNNFLSAKYQDDIEKYLAHNLGIKAFLIKTKNQVDYSFFNKLNTKGTVVGKNNFLFEKHYINAINGSNFKGTDSINNYVNSLFLLQKKLEQQGKQFIIALAPSKAEYYPEYIPDKYWNQNDSINTNYLAFKNCVLTDSLNLIDYNEWFIGKKDSLGELLIPKYGIHWSTFGALLATDSLTRYIAGKTNKKLPTMQFTDFNYRTKLSKSDYDIGRSLNLFKRLKTIPMCYPSYQWDNTEKNDTLNIVVIGDSFFIQLVNYNVFDSCFHKGDFLFYNTVNYLESKKSPINILTLHTNMNKLINNADAILLISSVASIPETGWGVVNDINNILDSSFTQSEVREKEILVNNILGSKRSYNYMLNRANKMNIELDSLVSLYFTDKYFFEKTQN